MSSNSLPKQGDRIVLVHMADDPDPIPPGTEGTVVRVQALHFGTTPPEHQILVTWDNGRSLACICPPDVVRVIQPELTAGSTASR